MTVEQGPDREFMLLENSFLRFDVSIGDASEPRDPPTFDFTMQAQGALLSADLGFGDIQDVSMAFSEAALSRADLVAMGLSMIEVALHMTPHGDTEAMSDLREAAKQSALTSVHKVRLLAILEGME